MWLNQYKLTDFKNKYKQVFTNAEINFKQNVISSTNQAKKIALLLSIVIISIWQLKTTNDNPEKLLNFKPNFAIDAISNYENNVSHGHFINNTITLLDILIEDIKSIASDNNDVMYLNHKLS